MSRWQHDLTARTRVAAAAAMAVVGIGLGIGAVDQAAAARDVAPSSASSPGTSPPVETNESWFVVGAGRDGHSVVVTTTRRVPACTTSRFELVDATARRVVLRLVFARDVPPNSELECLIVDDAAIPPAGGVVDIGRRLRGQRITGPKRVASKFPLEWYPAADEEQHPERGVLLDSVVGLQTAQALPILRSIGVRPSRIHVKGPRPGYVSQQTPAAGRRLAPKNPSITLTTKALP